MQARERLSNSPDITQTSIMNIMNLHSTFWALTDPSSSIMNRLFASTVLSIFQ